MNETFKLKLDDQVQANVADSIEVISNCNKKINDLPDHSTFINKNGTKSLHLNITFFVVHCQTQQ